MFYFRGMDLLQVMGVSKKERDLFAVKNISFTQQAFQKIAIAGETGSGKTTLLKLIGGFAQPDEGSIFFEGKKVRGPNDQLIPGHAGIAWLSQHFELRNNYWVHEILSYANELPEGKAEELFRVCRIDHLLNRRTDQLSGGEKQRIALARLLVGSPRLLLLDEPFSSLDALHKNIIKEVVDEVNSRLGISCILVSHDGADTLSWADTILVIKNGEIIQQDTPSKIYYQPVNEYCAGLFGDYNLVNVENRMALNIAGEKPQEDKQLLIRPEQFIISATGEGLAGIIASIHFMGAYYLLSVKAGDQTLKIRTTENKYSEGAAIRLTTTNIMPRYI